MQNEKVNFQHNFFTAVNKSNQKSLKSTVIKQKAPAAEALKCSPVGRFVTFVNGLNPWVSRVIIWVRVIRKRTVVGDYKSVAQNCKKAKGIMMPPLSKWASGLIKVIVFSNDLTLSRHNGQKQMVLSCRDNWFVSEWLSLISHGRV